MLSENIKTIRKSKGLSQEELAVKLNVVRQTVSKWEQGLSVPDADMLIAVSEALDTPVGTLLGENVADAETNELKAICEKLEVINLQLARRKTVRIKILRWFFICSVVATAAVTVLLVGMNSPYLNWNYSDSETAVLGTAFHAFEWAFARIVPLIFVGGVAGIVLTRKKS